MPQSTQAARLQTVSSQCHGGMITGTPSSIYTAFGDKKGLFMAAVRRYTSGPINSESLIRETATAQKAASGLLRAAAIGFTGEFTPRGCLLACSAISCSAMAQDIKDSLAELRNAIEACLGSPQKTEKIVR